MSGWASVSGGKWHRTVNDSPGGYWYATEKALCGLSFRPLNVTAAGDEPHVRDQYKCQRCEHIIHVAQTEGR